MDDIIYKSLLKGALTASLILFIASGTFVAVNELMLAYPVDWMNIGKAATFAGIALAVMILDRIFQR
ncbi:MAG: hypothetical protein KDK45_18055 [Leptospiraceae bacterium]|nr:hypothetical protein [Leptospiraceae bacterium]